MSLENESSVVNCSDLGRSVIGTFAVRYGLASRWLAEGVTIPGSFWGEREAGLIGNVLYCRPDTPIHSFLHELCHYVCMDTRRRVALHTNAGGNWAEEDAVCFLQAILADFLPRYSRGQLFRDMDAWGYSFRLGRAELWFAVDAQDARAWLIANQLITPQNRPRWVLRA